MNNFIKVKKVSKQKTKTKSIKFNLDEYAELQKILKDENLKFATFVKSLIFKRKTTSKKLEVSIQNAKSYQEQVYQIKKLGSNLNQIAKHCNQNKSVDYFMLKEIAQIKESLKRLANGS